MASVTEPDVYGKAGFSPADLSQLEDLETALTPLTVPDTTASFDAAVDAGSMVFQSGQKLIDRLPPRVARTATEQAAAEALHARLRAARLRFLRRWTPVLYRDLTDTMRRLLRVEQLVFAAARRVPGLAPTRSQIDAERRLPQKEKEGYEIDQGVLLSQILTHQPSGAHLVHVMLRPRPESLDLLHAFRQRGRMEIGTTTVEREGVVGYLYHGNPPYLNAEDDSTTANLEIGTDLILLDSSIEVGVMRGKVVDHPKYAGRRIFNAGINLTDLYWGRISLVEFFIARDMGYVNKMYRGLSGDEFYPDEIEPSAQEKPWIAAVETFAIGGGCQLLLAMDHVLAESSSYFNLPARKEGIIPGVSNMRLWRFVGDRAARQAILFERRFDAADPAGQLICDTLVPDGDMDSAIAQTVAALTGSGVVSAAGNRKAMRIGQESIDLFRQYMALYCREQAACHYSPQLIHNLEANWNAHQRAPRADGHIS
jgi:thioesterase DpgC